MEIDYEDEMTIETEEKKKKKNERKTNNNNKNIFNFMAIFYDCYYSIFAFVGKKFEIFFKLKEK